MRKIELPEKLTRLIKLVMTNAIIKATTEEGNIDSIKLGRAENRDCAYENISNNTKHKTSNSIYRWPSRDLSKKEIQKELVNGLRDSSEKTKRMKSSKQDRDIPKEIEIRKTSFKT